MSSATLPSRTHPEPTPDAADQAFTETPATEPTVDPVVIDHHLWGYEPSKAYVVVILSSYFEPEADGVRRWHTREDFDGERLGVLFNKGRAKFVAVSPEATEEFIIRRCGLLKEFVTLGYQVFEDGQEPKKQPRPQSVSASFDPSFNGVSREE